MTKQLSLVCSSAKKKLIQRLFQIALKRHCKPLFVGMWRPIPQSIPTDGVAIMDWSISALIRTSGFTMVTMLSSIIMVSSFSEVSLLDIWLSSMVYPNIPSICT